MQIFNVAFSSQRYLSLSFVLSPYVTVKVPYIGVKIWSGNFHVSCPAGLEFSKAFDARYQSTKCDQLRVSVKAFNIFGNSSR